MSRTPSAVESDYIPTQGSYLAPPAWRDDDPTKSNELNVLGWLAEARTEGIAYLNSQAAFRDLDQAMQIIQGSVDEKLPSPLSRVSTNIIKRDIREIVSVLTDLRDFWQFEASDKAQWGQHADILNKLMNGWYHETFVDLKLRDALQYAAVLGTGYLMPYWNPHFWDKFAGDIDLEAFGARDVLPVGLPPNHNLQQAYSVTIRQELPIHMVYRMWPTKRHEIVPDRDLPTVSYKPRDMIGRGVKTVMDFLTGAGEKNREDEDMPYPTCDVFYTYIDDYSLNRTGRKIPMGKPGSSYAYEVPALGSDVPIGFDAATNQIKTRQALEEDCYLYPNRRLIISTRKVLIYDGPSYWWHGMVPVIKFTLDDWPWQSLGFSLTRDTASLQNSLVNHLRNIDDSAAARLNPPFLWDKMVPTTDAERFNPRMAGIRMRFDSMRTDKPILFPFPPQLYDVPPFIQQGHLPFLIDQIHDQTGVGGVKALAQARQIPAGDSIEKLQELSGPLVRAMSRSMERSLRGLGQMVGALFFQFYDTKRRVKVLGKDGITAEDFDFDPMTLIPQDQQGFATSRLDRARSHYRNFTFKITPGSLHQINQTAIKLLYLQLFRTGFPIDPETVANKLDLPNWGYLPGANILEKWAAWADVQAAAAAQMQQGRQPGRPPSGQELPRIEGKDSGQRTTIRESK